MSEESLPRESGQQLQTIEELRECVTGLAENEWLAKNRHPFLVFALASQETMAGNGMEATLERPCPSSLKDHTEPYSILRGKITQIFVSALVGRGTNSDEPGFVLGRSLDADLVFPVASISASHCRFVPPAEPGGHWSCVDLGSKNGTFVSEQRLIPGVHHELEGTTVVNLGGSLAIWFLPPDEMWVILNDQAKLNALLSGVRLSGARPA